MSSPFSAPAEWVTTTVERLGYAGVFVLIDLESIFPPIPSELILPLAGFLPGDGRLWYPAAVAVATAGSVTGALAIYAIGAKVGEQRLRGFVRAHGRWLTLRVERQCFRACPTRGLNRTGQRDEPPRWSERSPRSSR